MSDSPGGCTASRDIIILCGAVVQLCWWFALFQSAWTHCVINWFGYNIRRLCHWFDYNVRSLYHWLDYTVRRPCLSVGYQSRPVTTCLWPDRESTGNSTAHCHRQQEITATGQTDQHGTGKAALLCTCNLLSLCSPYMLLSMSGYCNPNMDMISQCEYGMPMWRIMIS